MRTRIVTTLERFPWIVAEANHEVLGYAFAREFRARAAYRWSTEVGIYLAETARGQGLGRRLYSNLLEILMAQATTTHLPASRYLMWRA